VARTSIPAPEGPNSRWSVDFVHDQVAMGRRFRVLNIIDDETKECLAAVADTSLSGKRVVLELEALINTDRPARQARRDSQRQLSPNTPRPSRILARRASKKISG
jgi:transposase InsO family protein